MFREPPPSQGDLHFTILGFPVRVHPLFWVVALILGLNGSRRMIDVFIRIVAGFGAGFLLAIVVAGIVIATGHSVGVGFGAPYGVWVQAEGISQAALDIL